MKLNMQIKGLKNRRTKPQKKINKKKIIFTILVATSLGFGIYRFMPIYNKFVVNKHQVETGIKVPVLNKDLLTGQNISESDITYIYVDENIVPNNLINLSKINISKSYKAIMDIPKNTIILNDFFKTAYLDQDILQSSRLVEIDYLDLSYSNLNKGDYIDIRIEEKPDTKNDEIVNTNGYNNSIVLSKKKILEFDEDRMILKLNEEEIQNLGCAVYQMANYSSYIYFTKYVNPQTQDKAKITYQGSDQLKAIIEKDRLAVKKSEDELRKRLKDIEEENKKRDIQINSLNEYIKLNKVKDIEASQIKESSSLNNVNNTTTNLNNLN